MMLAAFPFATFVVALVTASACGSGASRSASEPATAQQAPEVEKSITAPETVSVADAPATVVWAIQEGRVGPVEIGKRLPDELLGDDLAAHYVARYIADGQPIDAFVYETPPVLIILASGPFRTQVENTGEFVKPAVDALRAQAATAARRGAKVQAIMIRGAGPTTEAGIGVGSTLAQLQAAYADLRLVPFPETLGGDTCRASTKLLPGIGFMFATCSKAKNGAPVTRLDISNPTK